MQVSIHSMQTEHMNGRKGVLITKKDEDGNTRWQVAIPGESIFFSIKAQNLKPVDEVVETSTDESEKSRKKNKKADKSSDSSNGIKRSITERSVIRTMTYNFVLLVAG